MNNLSKFVTHSFHAATERCHSKNQTFIQDNSLAYSVIPKEVFVYGIFTQLIFEEWLILSQVNKRMNNLLSDPVLLKEKIYREKTFNPDDWGTYFGNLCLGASDGYPAFKSLPDHIGKLFTGPSPVSKRKKLGQTHVIVWIPSGLCLNDYMELLGGCKDARLLNVQNIILDWHGNELTGSSEWVVMPRNRKKRSSHSYKIINFKNYAFPKVLEAVICITTIFLKSGLRFDPLTCEERIEIRSNGSTTIQHVIVSFNSTLNLSVYQPKPINYGNR